MLTRLEVSGFKNLLGFEVDFGPFTCIAGGNGVGKSNIFDAIQFLALLADNAIEEAARKVRGSLEEVSDVRGIFWTDGIERLDRLTMAAEMIVDAEVTDDFDRKVKATSTYLRYEIEVGYQPPEDGTLGKLRLLSESLGYFTKSQARKKLHFLKPDLREKVVINNRKGGAFIETHTRDDGRKEVRIRQDGGSFGRAQLSPVPAPRTIVSSVNTDVSPTILAARREMQSWRVLALEPSAMRQTDSFLSDRHITANGAHLPATLYRLASAGTVNGDSPEEIYATIASKLADLVPIHDLIVHKDERLQQLYIEAWERSGVALPARSLSDGTLRFLTLCILSEDPEARGLMCMEEPENGIHPAKLQDMLALLNELAVDPTSAPGEENIFRQVIIATHSPGLVQLQIARNRNALLFARETSVPGPEGRTSTTLRCYPLTGSERAKGREDHISEAVINAYLTVQPGSQIPLLVENPA